jgi:hypothetical protein
MHHHSFGVSVIAEGLLFPLQAFVIVFGVAVLVSL